MILVDTHTHIFGEAFLTDLEEVISRFQKAGVARALLPNIDSASVSDLLKTLELSPFAKPMWGLHPCHIFANWEEELEKIYPQFAMHPAVAVGEIGLDFYWSRDFEKEQELALKVQLQWALDLKLPVSLHTREATQRTIDLVKPFAQQGLKGVFHCFSGNETEAREIVGMGFCLGIGGTITYKNNSLKNFLPKIPIENLVLETDAPYLAPVPYRGKRNEPGYLVEVAFALASLYACGADAIAKTTSNTANNLFNLGLSLH